MPRPYFATSLVALALAASPAAAQSIGSVSRTDRSSGSNNGSNSGSNSGSSSSDRAAQAARERAEEAARQRAEQAAKARAEQAARERQEQAAQERAAQAAKERQEQAARERQEQAARERQEQAARERQERARAEQAAKERAEQAAREKAEQERAAQAARARAEQERAAREADARRASEASGKDLTIGRVTASGTGCPAGSWKAIIDETGHGFAVEFTGLSTSITAAQAESSTRCRLSIAVPVQNGSHSYRVSRFDYSGYTYLAQGVQAEFVTEYAFAGDPSHAFKVSTALSGPLDKDYTVTDDVGSEALWSPCSTSNTFNVDMTVKLSNAAARADGVMDVGGASGLALEVRACE